MQPTLARLLGISKAPVLCVEEKKVASNELYRSDDDDEQQQCQ